MKHLLMFVVLIQYQVVFAQPDWQVDEGIPIGCSVSSQAIVGYRRVSDMDRIRYLNQSQGALATWVHQGRPATHTRLWSDFDSAWEDGGRGVFIQVCVRDVPEEYENIDDDLDLLISMLSDRGISSNQIWLSPMIEWPTETSCDLTADKDLIGQAVEDAIQRLNLNRGPVTVATEPGHLTVDGCHLNAEGRTDVGLQLEQFFDLEPGLTVPVLDAVPACETRGFLAWVDGSLWGCDGQGNLKVFSSP